MLIGGIQIFKPVTEGSNQIGTLIKSTQYKKRAPNALWFTY